MANEITSAFSEGSVFTSPETDLEIAKYALKDFNAADAVKLLKSLFDGIVEKVLPELGIGDKPTVSGDVK